jgi:hypothetical protein
MLKTAAVACCSRLRGVVKFLFRREMIKGAIDFLAEQVFVEKVHERSPILVGKGVAMVGVIYAQSVFLAEQSVGGSRPQNRLFGLFGQGNRIRDTFERDKRARRGEREEPMLIERQLLALSPCRFGETSSDISSA